MGPYLDQALERELGLTFEDKSQTDIQELDDLIDNGAQWVGDRQEALEIPRAGFLREKLTAEQTWKINNILGPGFAKTNNAEQAKLLQIPIEESRELMVPIAPSIRAKNLDVSFSELPFHEACGRYAGQKRIWHIRQTTCERLMQVFRAFNEINIQPHLEDAFRFEEIQKGLLARRIAALAQLFPEWPAESLKAVAFSLTASMPAVAGHQAGAAVDFRLRDMQTKELLPLGNGYSDHGIHGCISFPYVTWEEYRTRMLFAHISRIAGFRLLTTENWHVSFGDRGMGIDGSIAMRKGVFGPIKEYDTMGAVTPYEPEETKMSYIDDAGVEKIIRLARVKNPGESRFQLTVAEAAKQYLHDKTLYDTRNKA